MHDNSDVRQNGQSLPRTTNESNATSPSGFDPAPSIVLPKGGGAIRGIGEKFAANPVTGTGSMTVPMATSPGRSGFGPQLSLSYDSGAGNGPFGFGWSLSLPSITRKTDKGLPQYLDADESDVFILSGAEDLVPELRPDGSRFEDQETVPGYTIHRYRPRIEGLFARIERWTNLADPTDVFWRSITKDNVTTFYGLPHNKADGSVDLQHSRIADPADATRIFSWLICESYDDKGNAIVYEYQSEDSQRIFEDQQGQFVALAHERNRSESSRSANRYLKRIKYGNRTPNRDATTWQATDPAQLPNETWMFEVVFDYGEGHYTEDAPDAQGRVFAQAQIDPPAAAHWPVRQDPFSTYRAGFEVRTYRLCQRVLMFHHFPGEAGVGQDCLVRSTDFVYRDIPHNPDDRRQGHPIAAFIAAVSQSGYTRAEAGGYLKKSLPPLEFEYSDAVIGQDIHDIDPTSLENLPSGVDGSAYQWVDLDGEGLSGVLTEQGGGWFYKRNESTLTRDAATEGYTARFAPVEPVARIPAGSPLTGSHGQFLDLAGDGQMDVVEFERPVAGFYERTDEQDWEPFRAFRSLPNLAWNDPNLKFIDLTGDGHADVLVTEDQAFTWYPSLAEEGFGAATRISVPTDEERGPHVVFADGTQTISLADLSGDGLTDIVRIRNGDVCYWPNLGYGRFGAKVTMDDAPWFDTPEQFDPHRLRLADIDGSGMTDIMYLGRNQTRLWFNQSGNAWSATNELPGFPPVDNVASVAAVDLLGNGTACLVWSSPLPGASRAPMQYLNLMAEGKPHLLVRTVNNLGAETRVHYAPSTSFYLQDKYAGKPWISKLPFPVHVVERVETYDHISRNHFVTRYAYHHGYFDGPEREFRGFGMVEQFDTEEFAALTADGTLPAATNLDAASHVPPVLTKTWFHTGIYLGRDRVSNFFAGLLDTYDRGEYYREPAWRDDDVEAKERLLDDTILPAGLTVEEEREACRALKGAMLRQEVDALDGTSSEDYPYGHPYTVTEQNFSIRALQRRGDNRHAVFFTHGREAISYHYERNATDPRITHALTLEVEDFGNVLKAVAVGYGRRQADANLPLQADRDKQAHTLVTYTENLVTNAIKADDDYRTPLPCETRTYELTGYIPTGTAGRFQQDDFVRPDPSDPEGLRQIHIFDNEIQYEANPTNGKQRRLIEHVRMLYRPDDLGEAQANPLTLLPLRTVEALALPGESYKLAFTPGLLAKVYQRPLDVVQPPGSPGPENLLPTLANVLGGQGADRGGYVDLDNNGHWWIPAGRVFLAPNSGDTSAPELAHARQHFFLPHRFRDPFGNETTVAYDSNASDPSRNHNLLIVETRDSLGNVVTVETTDNNGQTAIRNDYRVLQPSWVTDPNGNRTRVGFDALGMVVGTAMMGKPPPAPVEGDSLEPEAFQADLTQAQIDGFYDAEDPHVPAPNLLKDATTRIIYDLDRFHRTQQAHPEDPTLWLPVYAATLARETHVSDPLPPGGLKIQISFSSSDGFGREIQKKIQTEPGPVIEGGPVVSPRWVGSGWTIFNNKGKPVRQYEPFFSQLPEKRHRFEFGVRVGVSPIPFYDPVERVVATLHPNHTWEKVVFDPWQQTTYDVNDTVLNADGSTDPRLDQDVTGFFSRLPDADYIPTWYEQRRGLVANDPERVAADKAAVHRQTPTVAHFDTLGRTFLTVAHNRFERNNAIVEEKYPSRVELDIEGNQRAVRDAIVQNGDQQGRLVMRYDYDMLGNRIHQASMEAGERWMLNDVTGKPIRAWDSRGHTFRTEYDPLRRPLRSFVLGADPTQPDQELLTERLVYGEQHPEDVSHNLRGTLYLRLDQAGVVTSEAHDFKGNPLRATRRLTNETQYRQAVDWRAVDADHSVLPDDATTKLNLVALEAALAPRLEADPFASSTTYDALNRPLTLTTPHTPTMQPNVIRPGYNEANLLERVEANLRGATANGNGQPVWTPFVTNIDYDAKGQRTQIDYATKDGKLISMSYKYDRETFRLVHLYTRRGVDPTTRQGVTFIDDCDNPQPPPPTIAAPETPPEGKLCGLQNLHYTYDPVGNITHIRDDAQQTIFFRNKRVDPSADYTYDALYRLIEATGREHLGQNGAGALLPPSPMSYNDKPRVGLLHPGDGNAMGTYTQQFVYDEVGNFQQMIHRSSDSATPDWTRAYAYNEPSLLEPGKQSNRLTSTTVGTTTETYSSGGDGYDSHGNMLRMPHLHVMQWDFRDQLQMSQRQAVNADDEDGVQHQGERSYYVYDAGGQRVRKVIERQNGMRKNERTYLGGFEVYREYDGNGISVTLERETLHMMDDKKRIALIETKTKDTNQPPTPNPQPLIRYQFGNHLSSASLELDGEAQVISYEEYFPYGSTSYQAVRSQIETPKRYRYTGKERDEETGFTYHRARYYTPWLGRWGSCDPIGLEGGLNLYLYSHNNSIRFSDPEGTDPLPDVVTKMEVRGSVITTAQTIVREGIHSSLVTTYNPVAGVATQKLYRRVDNQNWTDVTKEASRQGPLSVEWNMPDLLSDQQRIDKIQSPGVIGTLLSGFLAPYLKDQTLQIRHPLYRMQARVLQTELRARDKVIKHGIEFAMDVQGAQSIIEGGIKLGIKLGARKAAKAAAKAAATELEVAVAEAAAAEKEALTATKGFTNLADEEIESALGTMSSKYHYRSPVAVSEAGHPVETLVPTSRWGRPGLQPGDWIMPGPPNRINYWLSFKWEPPWLGGKNTPAPRSAGEGYILPRDWIKWPSGFFGPIKGLFSQRQYIPPPL